MEPMDFMKVTFGRKGYKSQIKSATKSPKWKAKKMKETQDQDLRQQGRKWEPECPDRKAPFS